MRISFYLLMIMLYASSAKGNADSLLALGKAEFKKDYYSTDYATAATYLKEVVRQQPDNPEAHYFLAYALDRSTAQSAEYMMQNIAANTLEASPHLESVIRLSPRYQGELVVLDPYSKLSAIWGSLAMRYEYEGVTDSLRWALSEGAKRGGYRSFFREYAKLLLDECETGGILITSGDNITFPLKYVQIMEGYRNDVTVVDAGLMYTPWFPKMLHRAKAIPFLYSAEDIDTVTHTEWTAQRITIRYGNTKQKISWTVKPSIETLLTRGNKLLLNMLEANKFNRPVYLTTLQVEDRLNLEEHSQFTGFHYRIVPKIHKHALSGSFTRALELAKLADGKSQDEEKLMNNIRWDLLYMASLLIDEKRKSDAQKLFSEIELKMPLKRYPLGDEKKLYEAVMKSLMQ